MKQNFCDSVLTMSKELFTGSLMVSLILIHAFDNIF